MPDHTISDQRVGAVKEPVVEMKAARFPARLGWEPIIFAAKLRKVIPQQLKLHRLVHVDADQFAWPVPETFGQGPGIRNRLIKVCSRNVETVLLPKPKDLPKLCTTQTARHYFGQEA